MFLEALARCGNVKVSAVYVSMSREGAYRLKRRDRAFALAWEGAMVQARELAEDDLQDKALNGFTEQLHYHGEVLDTRTRFDGRLLLALLGRLDKRAESETALLGADRFDDLLDRIEADADAEDLLETPAEALARVEVARVAAAQRAAEAADREDEEDDPHMIWEEHGECWTDYPAPADYDGIEEGRYGEEDYRRTLSEEEMAALGKDEDEDEEERDWLARAEAQRRAAFGLDGEEGGAGAASPRPPAGGAGVGLDEAGSRPSSANAAPELAALAPTPAAPPTEPSGGGIGSPAYSRKREGDACTAPQKPSLDSVTRVTLRSDERDDRAERDLESEIGEDDEQQRAVPALRLHDKQRDQRDEADIGADFGDVRRPCGAGGGGGHIDEHAERGVADQRDEDDTAGDEAAMGAEIGVEIGPDGGIVREQHRRDEVVIADHGEHADHGEQVEGQRLAHIEHVDPEAGLVAEHDQRHQRDEPADAGGLGPGIDPGLAARAQLQHPGEPAQHLGHGQAEQQREDLEDDVEPVHAPAPCPPRYPARSSQRAARRVASPAPCGAARASASAEPAERPAISLA